MSELLDHVDQSIRARRLFRPAQRILVAVSGGVDSMVLLHLLHELAARYGWRLTAAHFNHQLRGRSSDADERLVRRTARDLNVPLVVETAAVAKLARARKLSLEMAAREVRHGFLARTARRLRIPTVALAHHADDQLELFFLRLLRGSGGEGLSGMKWRSPSASDPGIELVRPLLDQPKAALFEYAGKQGVRYREDASNALLDFQRNRIRHELLPLLRGKYQPALDRTILRVMEIVGAEAEFAGQAAREWMREGGGPKAEGRRPKEGRRAKAEVRDAKLRNLLDRGFSRRLLRAREKGGLLFDELAVAVQRRCVQLQLVDLGIVPDYDLVEQLRVRADRPVAVGKAGRDSVANADSGKGGTPVLLYAVRNRLGMVRLEATGSEGHTHNDSYEFNLSSKEVEFKGGAGEVEFDGVKIGWRMRPTRTGGPRGSGLRREFFDADKVGSVIRLRHWQPGDRFQPIGMASPVKLQDWFTNLKVPRVWRRHLVVAAAASGELFWVEGMRIAERFKLTEETNRRLQWRWKRL